MKFTENKKQFPGRKRIIKVDAFNVQIPNTEEIYVRMERAEGDGEEGTPVTAENLNKGNWRDDESVSFISLKDNHLPVAKTGEAQIVTKLNGEVWIIRPDGKGDAFKIGDVNKENLKELKLELETRTTETITLTSSSARHAAQSADKAERACEEAQQLAKDIVKVAAPVVNPNFVGEVKENDQRVYSPNNPQPAPNNMVTMDTPQPIQGKKTFTDIEVIGTINFL